MSVDALRDLGYTVMEAADARQAITQLAIQPRVDLLFTDIVMPEMNGRQLADKARELRPNLSSFASCRDAPSVGQEPLRICGQSALIGALPHGRRSHQQLSGSCCSLNTRHLRQSGRWRLCSHTSSGML
jgi:Response regulator receiver domain